MSRSLFGNNPEELEHLTYQALLEQHHKINSEILFYYRINAQQIDIYYIDLESKKAALETVRSKIKENKSDEDVVACTIASKGIIVTKFSCNQATFSPEEFDEEKAKQTCITKGRRSLIVSLDAELDSGKTHLMTV